MKRRPHVEGEGCDTDKVQARRGISRTTLGMSNHGIRVERPAQRAGDYTRVVVRQYDHRRAWTRILTRRAIHSGADGR